MKLGKNIKLDNYKNNKITYGTVNYIDLKSIYININSWVIPSETLFNNNTLLLKLKRDIRNLLSSYISDLFKDKFIINLDIKTKNIRKDKPTFMDLEVTLFVNYNINVRSSECKHIIQSLSNKIIDKLYEDNLLSFNIKKNNQF